MATWKITTPSGGSGIALPSSLQLMPWETKANCYKLTDTTTKGLGRMDKRERIYLINSFNGKNFTDGKNIYVDLSDPEAWLITGHELSHNAFGSNPAVAREFSNRAAADLSHRYVSQGVKTLVGMEDKVSDILFFMINALDDWRCAYWWSQPFPGDYELLLKRWRAFSEQRMEAAKSDILQFFLCTMLDCAPPDADKDFLALQPVFEQAYDDVIGVDFHTCLNVGQSLLEGVVHILAQDMKEEQDKQKQDSSQSGETQDGAPGDGDAGDPGDGSDAKNDSDKDGSPEDGQTDTSSAPGEKKSDGENNPGEDEGSSGDATATAPTPAEAKKAADKAKREERREQAEREAFRLAILTGQFDPKKLDEDGWADQKLSKWMQDRFDTGKIPRSIQEEVDAARGMDLTDKEDQDARAANLQQIAEDLRSFGEEKDQDDWLLADAKAKVRFNDLDASDIELRFEDLTEEGRRLAGRSRTVFQQILGQKRVKPKNAGPKLHIPSMIQRRFTGQGKVFRQTVRSKGFNYIVLIDGSGSMIGARFAAVSRAKVMLDYALDFPLVEGEVWVYRLEGNEVVLTRIDKSLGGMPGSYNRDVVGGLTPSHTAIRVAARALQLKSGVRRLLHLTDGAPNTHASASAFVRANILEARRFKVGTHTLFIEDAWGKMNTKDKSYLAGGPLNWRSCGAEEIEEATFDLVEGQFKDFLQHKI